MRISSLLIPLIVILAVMQGASCDKLEDLKALLPHSREEVDMAIMKALISENSHIRNMGELANKFKEFSVEWKGRMVEYLIKYLEIENPEEARKNPELYFINFDTYKLLVDIE
jgi:hypothetical protein